MNIERMPLAQFRLAPTHEVRTHKELCVMVHKREAFYSVAPERMKELLEAEKLFNDRDNALYAAYDCAISALELVGKNNDDVKMYLEEIIKCYMGDEQ